MTRQTSAWRGAYALATDVMACNFMHPEAAEGVDAFMEKRPPKC